MFVLSHVTAWLPVRGPSRTSCPLAEATRRPASSARTPAARAPQPASPGRAPGSSAPPPDACATRARRRARVPVPPGRVGIAAAASRRPSRRRRPRPWSAPRWGVAPCYGPLLRREFSGSSEESSPGYPQSPGKPLASRAPASAEDRRERGREVAPCCPSSLGGSLRRKFKGCCPRVDPN